MLQAYQEQIHDFFLNRGKAFQDNYFGVVRENTSALSGIWTKAAKGTILTCIGAGVMAGLCCIEMQVKK